MKIDAIIMMLPRQQLLQRPVLLLLLVLTFVHNVGGFGTLFGAKSPAQQQSRELKRLLTSVLEDSPSDEARRRVLDRDVPQLIDALEAAPSTFDQKKGLVGLWKVLYVRGTNWQRYFAPLKQVKTDGANKSYQWVKNDGSFRYIAQLAGESLFVTTDGTYVLNPASTSSKIPTPVVLDATVTSGTLHLPSRTLPLSFIKGTGIVNVLYSDDALRIFRNEGGGVVVQVRAQEEEQSAWLQR